MKKKRVFVTGGAKGIGRAIVRKFYEAGYRVAFCDADRKAGEELVYSSGTDLLFFPLDVKNEQALSAVLAELFEQWGDLDILVNNVGIGNFTPLTETTVQQFDEILATNLRPVFITSRALAIRRNTPEGKNNMDGS